MSDSDNSEENLGYYGKPLEPYDEDAFPKKKPITIEEQVATDEQGRRRFHGAFTGGFSAGFYNTVGSLEGWKPAEFKSSRSEKNEVQIRKPEDFMDDEDMGEFGIAPHLVQAKEGFSTKKKRKKETHSIGPIPGIPVLETLLETGNETIGYILLRNMGFKQSADELDDLEEEEEENDVDISEEAAGKKVYGCEIPKTYAIKKSFDNKKYEIPKVYEVLLKKPKDNTFGLGYSGLDKSHINLFQPQKRQTQNLVIPGKTKRTNLNIQGQAFGVGAFEEEDDDIYVKDDMSGYDFELTADTSKANSSNKQTVKLVHDMFLLSTDTLTAGESFPPPTIPHSFTGKYKTKKSRFEPVADENADTQRGGLNAQLRARYLGEGGAEGKTYTATNFQQRKSAEDLERGKKNEAGRMKRVEEFEEKQQRALDAAAQGFLFDRFVSASKPEDPLAILEPVARSETEHGTLQMREAVRMKMFGPLTRETSDWQPCALLCKRFNLPEPATSEFGSKHERKRTKNLIFQFQQFDDSGPDLKAGLSANTQKNPTETNQNNEDANISPENIQKSSENITSTKETSIASTIVSSNVNSSSNNPTPSSSSNKLTSSGSSDNPPSSVSSNNPPSSSSSNNPTPSSSSYVEDINEPSSSAPTDIMNKIDISQNRDLFKAIFADSSDDETDIAIDSSKDTSVVIDDETLQRNELLKATVLSDEFIPIIKSMKIGILSDIKFPVIEDVSQEIDGDKEEPDVIEKDFYGPKLPEKIIFKKPLSIIKDRDVMGENSDEWIEKGSEGEREKDVRRKKRKKEKKHKKSKHKHRKK